MMREFFEILVSESFGELVAINILRSIEVGLVDQQDVKEIICKLFETDVSKDSCSDLLQRISDEAIKLNKFDEKHSVSCDIGLSCLVARNKILDLVCDYDTEVLVTHAMDKANVEEIYELAQEFDESIEFKNNLIRSYPGWVTFTENIDDDCPLDFDDIKTTELRNKLGLAHYCGEEIFYSINIKSNTSNYDVAMPSFLVGIWPVVVNRFKVNILTPTNTGITVDLMMLNNSKTETLEEEIDGLPELLVSSRKRKWKASLFGVSKEFPGAESGSEQKKLVHLMYEKMGLDKTELIRRLEELARE